MSQKFIYIKKIENICQKLSDSEDKIQFRDLFKDIKIYKDNVKGDTILTMKKLRDIGYVDIKLERHAPISQENIDLIVFQFEQSGFCPDITTLSINLRIVASDIQYRRSIIDFNVATLGDISILDRELKILNDLYRDFNALQRELLHGSQIVGAMA